MWIKYLYVFLASAAVDIVPLPLPPAFVVMVLLQIHFGLDVWPVIIVGVAGSVLGRFILTLYIPKIAKQLFNPAKNEDVQYLGRILKEKGWKSQLVIIAYSLLPLPTTPLFVAAGMAKIRPFYIIPAFFVGKFTSDTVLVYFGKYGTQSAEDLLHGVVHWQTVLSVLIGIMILSGLLFIDWRSLIQTKKFKLNFRIWK